MVVAVVLAMVEVVLASVARTIREHWHRSHDSLGVEWAGNSDEVCCAQLAKFADGEVS